MTIYIFDPNGKRLSQSRNLRGILRRSSVIRAAHPCDTREPWRVRDVTLRTWPSVADSGAAVTVRWRDGSFATARFEPATVARAWCEARRGWPPAVTRGD